MHGLYPFWFWNGLQNESELSAQLDSMKAAGCDGVVLHSRTGNRVPYLSDRWLDLVEHACAEAERLGLKIWIYDEDGYPSGNAGGRVQADRPDLRQQWLTFAYEPTDPSAPAYAAYDPGSFALLDEKNVPAGTPALRFTIRYWDRHVDTLSPEAAHRFLSLTHERYAARLSRFFGKVVTAVYTDDESHQVWRGDGLTFSPFLEAAYLARFHTPLRDVLPALVENLPSSAAVRTRHHALVRDLFLENFIAPQVAWCHAHGLVYIGHLCGDEGPSAKSIREYGSATPYYVLEDVPSVDDYLCDMKDHGYLRRPATDDSLHTQFAPSGFLRYPPHLYAAASSAAHQFHDGVLSSETIAFLGWDVQPAFLATQIFYEVAQGVTLNTPHAWYYTVGGAAHHDCPPTYGHQQPFLPALALHAPSWTRAAALLRRGPAYAPVLVLRPDSVFALEDGSDIAPDFTPRRPRTSPAPADFDLAFNTLLIDLARAHIPFEMTEESVLLAHGRPSGRGLVLGAAAYSAVVSPGGYPLSAAARTLLSDFAAAGGLHAVWDGKTLPEELVSRLSPTPSRDALSPPRLSGPGSEEILLRPWTFTDSATGGRRVESFLVNLSGHGLEAALDLPDETLLYNPLDGTGFVLPAGSHGVALPKGAPLALLSPSYDCPRVAPETTMFRAEGQNGPGIVPRLVSVVRDRPNAVPLARKSPRLPDALPRPLALYAENLDAVAPALPRIPHHPSEAALAGALVDNPDVLVPALLASIPSTLYLEGDFSVPDAGTRELLPGGSPLGLGDLSAQGLPFYWGSVTYTFEFDGPASLLRADLAGGAAVVSLNGTVVGPLFGEPSVLRVADAVLPGRNTLAVAVYPTAANFHNVQPAPFGLVSVVLQK